MERNNLYKKAIAKSIIFSTQFLLELHDSPFMNYLFKISTVSHNFPNFSKVISNKVDSQTQYNTFAGKYTDK